MSERERVTSGVGAAHTFREHLSSLAQPQGVYTTLPDWVGILIAIGISQKKTSGPQRADKESGVSR